MEYTNYDEYQCTVTNLIPGTSYSIFLFVICNGIESEPITASRTTGNKIIRKITVYLFVLLNLFATIGPACVTNLKASTLSKSEIKVSWMPPPGGIDDYDLAIRPTVGVDGETDPRGVQEAEYVFKRLVPGSLYTITVVPNARNISGPVEECFGYTCKYHRISQFFLLLQEHYYFCSVSNQRC